jgi:putative YhbY family RNA-binding protein
MPLLALSPAERQAHRAAAHALDPVVAIGADGATAAVRSELDRALAAHGLVKVRVHEGDREARAALLLDLAEALSAAPVQHIGRLLVLWRPPAPKARPAREDRGPGPQIVTLVKASRSGNHRPTVRRVKLLGNQRVTAGGLVKRARKRPAAGGPAGPKKRQG